LDAYLRAEAGDVREFFMPVIDGLRAGDVMLAAVWHALPSALRM
jgi:hypothetical protein